MRNAVLSVLVPLGLAACTSTGGFTSPTEMSAADKCLNVEGAIVIAESEGASEDTMRRLNLLADIVCGQAKAEAEAAALAG